MAETTAPPGGENSHSTRSTGCDVSEADIDGLPRCNLRSFSQHPRSLYRLFIGRSKGLGLLGFWQFSLRLSNSCAFAFYHRYVRTWRALLSRCNHAADQREPPRSMNAMYNRDGMVLLAISKNADSIQLGC